MGGANRPIKSLQWPLNFRYKKPSKTGYQLVKYNVTDPKAQVLMAIKANLTSNFQFKHHRLPGAVNSYTQGN
jgi:hypothetical protein